MSTKQIIEMMPARYKKGSFRGSRTYYFSVDGTKYTVVFADDACSVSEGKPSGEADVVLKTTEKLFKRMVVDGKMPGPLDIARGKIKTNDPAALKALKGWFDI
jgi:hypothetical protein